VSLVLALTVVLTAACARDPLVRASLLPDHTAVERALESGSSPDSVDHKRRSVLELAVLKRHPANVRILAKAGADVNKIGPYGKAPLHWTAVRGYPEITKILLEHDAKADIQDARIGSTPLIEAAYANHAEVARLLLAEGADPNAHETRRHGGTALHAAIQTRRPQIVHLLMDAGADPSLRNRRGESALELARRMRRPEIIALVEGRSEQPTPTAVRQSLRPSTASIRSVSNRPPAQVQSVAVDPADSMRTITEVTSAGSYNPGYGRRVAAVIGINDYVSWPQLEGARADATRFAETLRGIGFDHVEEIYDRDASRERILRLVGTELVQQTGKDDLAVIFFAGHGHTETLANGEKRGYIVPADGDPYDVFATGISMSTLRELSNRLPAKHVYYAMDSCYSGLGFARGIRIPQTTTGYLDMLQTRRAVQMVTAGGEGEQAFERGGRGLFTSYLIRGLSGEADFDGDGAVTASELGTFVRPQVSTASSHRQTPQFGTIDGMGEVVFQLR